MVELETQEILETRELLAMQDLEVTVVEVERVFLIILVLEVVEEVEVPVDNLEVQDIMPSALRAHRGALEEVRVEDLVETEELPPHLMDPVAVVEVEEELSPLEVRDLVEIQELQEIQVLEIQDP